MKTRIEDAEDFFSEIYFGKHHLPGKLKPYGEGWCVNHYGELATFDFDMLTRIVFLAHDRCMRVSIENSGPRMVKIVLWQRAGRKGSIYERHPTIEDSLEVWRKKHN